MRVLIDVNLSPSWVEFLEGRGIRATHWSRVGDLKSPDSVVMGWARDNGYVVFTHDLDYSALLAATRALGPSVIQVRTHDVLPARIGELVARVLRERAAEIERGSVVTIDERDARVRLLPIGRSSSPD